MIGGRLDVFAIFVNTMMLVCFFVDVLVYTRRV